ncbi:hypothetical protein [Francisella philomiragia]|uniref:Uncharacterized protein n=1 Tax=Francisella philomiragia TaxID=28110 RepID=A0ABS1GC81_9GAMM|nr:hypothetical protein [Francisella philomiragia]MBK2258724.1 hypothetical protein [Francisella philomiragia]MBK2302415.1 hypothetical protein [Francisella philomiragia]
MNNNTYCIKFDVPKNLSAIEFSKKMNDFLQEIDNFNHAIFANIDETYRVSTYIEDVETGSIKWWLYDKIGNINDNAIDAFVDKPIKNTVATILKSAKKTALSYLEKSIDKEINAAQINANIIEPIQSELDTNINQLENISDRDLVANNIKIDKKKLLVSLSSMSKISNQLGDNVYFIEDSQNENITIRLSNNFEYSDKLLNDVDELEQDIEINNVTDYYQLITPTSKKNSKWEFKDGEQKIKCNMLDDDFFNKYVDNTIKLGGNELFKVKVRIESTVENNKIKKEYSIIEVIEHKTSQMSLIN